VFQQYHANTAPAQLQLPELPQLGDPGA